MEWPLILGLALGIPVLMIPVAFIWYINVSGIYTVIRETQKRRAFQRKRIREVRLAGEPVLR